MYISYTKLFATVNCVLTQAVRTGGTYNTLLAYPPEALSTQACTPLTVSDDPFVFDKDFKAINYTQMEEQTAFCSERDYTILGNTNAWTSRSVPFYLSFPPGLSLIDPAWKSCKNFEPGAFDPPRTLSKATALVSLGLGSSQTSTAAPGAKPQPSHVSATPTPTAKIGENNASPGSQESDPPLAGPTEDDPTQKADPPAVPALNSAAVSSAIQHLPLGGNKPEASAASYDPNTPGGSGEGPPPGVVGNNAENPSPAANGQGSGPADTPPGGSQNAPVDNKQHLSSLGNDHIQKAEGGGIVIGSTTLRPGDQTTKDGTPLSVGSDRIVIGDITIPLTAPTGDIVSASSSIVMAAPDPVVVGGNTVDRLPGGELLIAGSTYSPGTRVTISGVAVSVAADNLIVDGITHSLPSQITPTPVLLGGQTIAKASHGGVVIGTSTYLPGYQGNVLGEALSVGLDNVVLDGSTYTLPTYPTAEPILIDGKSITRASNGAVVIGDSTIAPGSQAIISSHTISNGFSSLVVDGSTYQLPTDTVSKNAVPQSLTLANGVVISAGGSGATISGTTYSIPSDDRELIVNGKTMALPTGVQSVFTVAGQTFTANPTGFVINGHSVAIDGSAVTLSGSLVSLGSGGLQIGSTTFPLSPAQETADLGLGGLIILGFGNAAGTAANTSSPLAFTGGSPRLREGLWRALLPVIGMCIVW